MERNEQRKKIRKFLNETHDPDIDGSIHEALYSMSELGMFPDGESVSFEQAIMCWKLVEQLRITYEKSFPKELWM